MHDKKQKGFTLIELLVVIVIIGLLAAIIFVAVDPAQRFGDARDARRRAEVVSILNAVLKYQVDHDGDLPADIDATPGTYQILGIDASGCSAACGGFLAAAVEDECLDLTDDLVTTGGYLASIPMDPDTGDANNTRYYLNQTTNGRITVGACDPENATAISVSR